MPPAYKCIPSCLKCRTSGLCDQSYALKSGLDGITVPRDEEIRTRAHSDPHGGQVRLPCGCLGLPWPIVQAFGTDIEEIMCDRHGWLVLPKKKREKMRRDAHKKKGEEAGLLYDDIPF
jgi:hypothetical protein